MNHYQTTAHESLDESLTLLANSQCRAILEYFHNSSENVASVEDLADEISDNREAEQTVIRLHHSTLPKLADAGIIEYDTRSQTVRYRSDSELESLQNHIVCSIES